MICYFGSGSNYFFCNGVPKPRGTSGDLPWQHRLDLNFTYKPEVLPGVTFKTDVFNVFNEQIAEQIRESSSVANRSRLVETYSVERSVKFTLSYNKKF